MTSHEPEPGAGLTDTEREEIDAARRRVRRLSHDRITSLRGNATDAELRKWRKDHPYPGTEDDAMFAAVERIVAARTADLRAERDRLAAQVAVVEALRDEWAALTEPEPEDYDGTPEGHQAWGEWFGRSLSARDLRAALATGAAEGGDES